MPTGRTVHPPTQRRRAAGLLMLVVAVTVVSCTQPPASPRLTTGTGRDTAASVNYPDPEPVRGPAQAHDPSMIQLADGSWEVFATHHGIDMYRSPDRVTWHYSGQALPGGAAWADAYQPGGAKDLWAPDV